MNVVVIPFFLVAHVSVEKPWEHGPEYVFQVHVNSTAIPEDGNYGSVRLNLETWLICQPKNVSHSLSCHFKDSVANSFVAESLDPSEPAVPAGQVNRQEAYEVNEDQFELKFNDKGLDSLVVNENIQPRELDMIRMIVGQLNIGANFNEAPNDETFNEMENFTQGECVTTFNIDRKFVGRPHTKRGFALRPAIGLKERKMVQIRKIRDLRICTHKVSYFFGSAQSFRDETDIISDVRRAKFFAPNVDGFDLIESQSDSHIIVTSTEFISSTSNVITTSRIAEAVETTLYENVRMRLQSIRAAEGEPPPVTEAEQASIFIGRWLIDDLSQEDD